MMRVLVIVPGYPADASDSASMPAVVCFIKALNRAADVQVLSLQYPYEPRAYVLDEVKVDALGGAHRAWARVRLMARALSVAKSYHRASSFQAVHAFWLGESSFLGQRLAKSWGVPFVASVGGQEAKQPSLLSRRLDRKQATVTAGSAFASAWLARTTGRSADQVIPLGLDVEDWPRGPQPSKDIDVLGVGSLSTLKRYHEWIEVVRALAVEQPNLRAVLAGDGPERGRLEQLIQRYGLSRHIELLGLRPREEVLPLMRRARVLLHPSDYESQGYVFLEALHAGADVVSRPVGHRPPGPYVREANDVAGFVAATRTALARPARKPQAVPTTADTVAAFMSLYRGVRPPLGSDPAGGPTP